MTLAQLHHLTVLFCGHSFVCLIFKQRLKEGKRKGDVTTMSLLPNQPTTGRKPQHITVIQP